MCGSGLNAKLPSAAVTVLEMTVKSVSSAYSRASVTVASGTWSVPVTFTGSP